MDDNELRAMVRDSITRLEGARRPAVSRPDLGDHAGPHASHALLALVRGGDAEGNCLIEPAVRCNHCGYCQSLGH
jgi:hypothetical protein